MYDTILVLKKIIKKNFSTLLLLLFRWLTTALQRSFATHLFFHLFLSIWSFTSSFIDVSVYLSIEN